MPYMVLNLVFMATQLVPARHHPVQQQSSPTPVATLQPRHGRQK